jgi:hypothetical protein
MVALVVLVVVVLVGLEPQMLGLRQLIKDLLESQVIQATQVVVVVLAVLEASHLVVMV